MATTSDQRWQALFDTLQKVRTAWPTRGWSWDTRLSCVASSFQVDFESQARAALKQALPQEWTPDSLTKAPPVIRDLMQKYGDLRSGQFLFTPKTPPSEGPWAIGLWWPWGNGETVSLRLGLEYDRIISEIRYGQLREAFRVSL